jgi:ubiquinol-cytochrome c reductase cytochrome c subunit
MIALAVLAAGAMLYQTQCASCHGARGQGSALAPPIAGRSASDVHLMLDTGRMPAAVLDANEIHQAVRLSPAQADAIVAYVLRFDPHADASLPVVKPGNVDRGRALFSENCAQCHGIAGNGSSVGYDDVAPSLLRASAIQVAEAIRAGPDVMPRFGRDVLSDRDVDDITAYVEYLRSPSASGHDLRAGGIALSHVGPVAEGFVAWIFGLGALVLFVRAIGTNE